MLNSGGFIKRVNGLQSPPPLIFQFLYRKWMKFNSSNIYRKSIIVTDWTKSISCH